MRASNRRIQIETLETRDVPAMFVPTLSPHAVTVATPDHSHAAVVRQYVRFDVQRLAAQVAATIGPIIDTRAAAGQATGSPTVLREAVSNLTVRQGLDRLGELGGCTGDRRSTRGGERGRYPPRPGGEDRADH